MRGLCWTLGMTVCLWGTAAGQEEEEEEPRDAPLMLAMHGRHPRSGDVDRVALVREILAAQPDAIERATGERVGPLGAAINAHDAPIAELLLEFGADPNARYGQETVLHQAGKLGRIEIVELLLDAGAEVRQRDFVSATRSGQTRVMELLLEHGARADAPAGSASMGAWPMQAAAESSQLASLGFLLGCGARVSLPEARYQPLHLAARGGHAEVVRLLLDHGAPVDPEDVYGRRPAELAILRGHEEVLRLLVARGANRTPFVHAALGELWTLAPTEGLAEARLQGETLLHAAARFGRLQAARTLVEAGVDPATADAQGVTPLLIAARRGDLPLARFLLEAGAPVNAASSHGTTPLHGAAAARSILAGPAATNPQAADEFLPLVELFLEHGADVEAAQSPSLYVGSNWRPLHLAIAAERVDLAVALLRAGAESDWTGENEPLLRSARSQELLAKAVALAQEPADPPPVQAR
ncbi:MAG: ankyrin repeat domain-containing protein [Planctomycetota bacterium]